MPPPIADADNDDDDVTFESLGLHPQLCKACADLGYKTPTGIQRQAIPFALQGARRVTWVPSLNTDSAVPRPAPACPAYHRRRAQRAVQVET